jgi:hypothetical protein
MVKKKAAKVARIERKLSRTKRPERAARLGNVAGVKDAFCTECKEYYDSNTEAQKHAH